MNKLLYLLFLALFVFDYLATKLKVVSHYLTLMPELFSVLVLLIIPVRFMVDGGKNMPPKCVFFLILLLLNILIGAVVNMEPAGPLIAGMRAYLKPIPFFLLPFVYPFSDEQIRRQLKFLLLLFFLQPPVSLYQRLVQSRDLLTGDLVVGTVGSSGHLTIVLTSAIAILMSFYLAKRISLKSFISLFILLFVPMTINETKATLILLPAALVLPMLFSSKNVSLRQYIPMIVIGVATGFAFVTIYDHFMKPRWGYGILDFLTLEGRAESYLYKGAETSGTPVEVGKVDSYVLAFKSLSDNLLHLMFGLGIGNVSESFVAQLSGEYAAKYSAFNVNGTSLALILWELGLFGVLLYYVFYFMAYKDARRLSQEGGFIGTFAIGWSAVTVIMMLSTAYINVVQENITGYLFWYFSGYVIAESYKYQRAAAKRKAAEFSAGLPSLS